MGEDADGQVYSGGCQCGAVRFRLAGRPGTVAICHCRMCQKAFGGYFAPLVDTGGACLEWTRGVPSHFQSSNVARRGFCAGCGTPLTYEWHAGVALAAGAFDDPAALPPALQFATGSRLPFFAELASLPARPADQEPAPGAYSAGVTCFQHPDHDTAGWPPQG